MADVITDYNGIIEVLGQLKQVLIRGLDSNGVVNTLSIDGGGSGRVKDGNMTPLGYARYATLSSVITLPTAPTAGVALPASAKYALLQAVSQNVMWRDDGANPSATEGMILVAGDPGFWYSGDLAAIRFIQAAAGAVLRVAYYA